MGLRAALLWGMALFAALIAPALALDYRSVSEPAILFDAPSQKGVKLFIVARGTPVEVVLFQENWTKVRDGGGNMAWIETRLLLPARTLLIRADKADIRATPDDKGSIVFSAEKNVVLDLLEAAPPGWAKIRHRDGQTGYVKAVQVWGL